MDVERINITICGDGGTGKSSITLRLVRSAWTHEYDPTIEDSYSVTRTVDGTPYQLSLTDTAGQEEYRGLWASSNLRSDAFLLVYDITNPATLYEQLPIFLEMIEMEADRREDAGEVQPVVVVVGNKCDLGMVGGERKISSREGLEWARARGCGFMETSARECVNVEETFALMVRRVVEARTAHAAPRGDTHHTHGDSFSRTPALPPINEKAGTGLGTAGGGGGGMDYRGKQGMDMGGQSFWSKLKCW